MNKPSERIVVFVTTAQKRAISATAAELGISVSELMRRAVLSFGATSEQVKAASIVDRLNAPRAPDALDAALQRVAHGTRQARAALPAALQTHGDSEAGASAGNTAAMQTGAASTRDSSADGPSAGEPTPLLPADVSAALAAGVDEEAAATAEAVARVAAAKATSAKRSATPQAPQTDPQAQARSVLKRPRIDGAHDEDDPLSDPSTEGGRFA